MTFAHPEWLLCLTFLPILALISWLAWRQRGKRWQKLVAPRLQKRLSRTQPAWVHFTGLGLALLGLTGLIVAFAQPESGEEWIEVESEGRNILFCVDISRSMLAEDVQPSRLQASRAAALEILERFPNDRVGVLLFAGENLMQSPLTLDHGFVEQTLAQLDPADIPYGGSNLSGAINDGVRMLTQTGQQSNIMVVFSDGEGSTVGVEPAAAKAAREGIFIYALGMGTNEGSFIPDPRQRDGKFRDRSGNPVFTRLDEEALRTVASKTDGFYSRGIGGEFLKKLDSALTEMDRFREEGKHQRVAKPAHQWFLFGGLLLLMISIFIRTLPHGRTVALLAGLFFITPQAEASLISDGRDALERGEQLEAHQFFRLAAQEESGERAARLQLAAGSAAYRAKSWHAAADSFSNALSSENVELQEQAHYALATSLFYLGVPTEGEEQIKAWQGSVKHFKAALDLNPDHAEAASNLKQVEDFLRKKEEEEKEEQQQNEEEKKEDQEEDKKDKPEDSEQDQEKDQEEKEGDQGEDGDEGDEGDQSNEEKPSEDQESKGDQSEEGEPQDNPEPSENEGEGENEGEEEPQPGEEGKDSKGDPEQSDEGKKDGKNDGENNGEPQNGDPSKNPEGKPQEAQEAKQAPEPKTESREERARRLLKQYADFGEKAPRRVRRPYNRASQDW